jgi:hypothetical protein
MLVSFSLLYEMKHLRQTAVVVVHCGGLRLVAATWQDPEVARVILWGQTGSVCTCM